MVGNGGYMKKNLVTDSEQKEQYTPSQQLLGRELALGSASIMGFLVLGLVIFKILPRKRPGPPQGAYLALPTQDTVSGAESGEDGA